tara:strand:+ start:1376 stop:3943 length:2568 start_codon:yes stop_codon:yes gene_type:complete
VAKYIPTMLPVNSLSGGVGRQAQSKRMPSEVQVMDNVYCTLEHSIERRRGTDLVLGQQGFPERISNSSADIWYQWLIISEFDRYLVTITKESPIEDFLHIWKLGSDGTLDPVAAESILIEEDCYKYLQHGDSIFKQVAIGTSMLILNEDVEAGFTSDGVDGFLFDFEGNKLEELDATGKELEYKTALSVDPDRGATIWTQWSTYISGDEVIDPTLAEEGAIPGLYRMYILTVTDDTIKNPTVTPPRSDAQWQLITNDDGTPKLTEFIPVKDYLYPDPAKPELGQSVFDLSKINLPPPEADMVDKNNAEALIASLYPGIGNIDGKGKIYYIANTYGTTTPGYYRVKAHDKQPYLHKVRTPDKLSILDKRRMPMQLAFNAKEDTWLLRAVDWDARTSGTQEANPGPSAFSDKSGNAMQAKITSLSFYRDRLFLSSGDKLFCSRMGNWDNFWIDDPSNIVATDPIDLSVSSNKYSPITHTVPFNDFLFINTAGDTQFELIGSENQITPFTAEIAPTTFFSTLSETAPQLMASQIYFFGDRKLYIYFNSEQSNINQAINVSNHCPGYLPSNPVSIETSPAHDSIFFVDGDNQHHLYVYTNRFAGDKVVQNAFYRHTFAEGTEIKNLKVFNDILYITLRTGDSAVYMVTMPLSIEVDLTGYKPRLDMSYPATSATYDSVNDVSSFELPYENPHIDTVVVTSALNNRWLYKGTASVEGGVTTLQIPGRLSGSSFLLGNSFSTRVELSEQFVRNEQNNSVDGVLNLRSLNLRHTKTGIYNVEVSRRGRPPEISEFTLLYADGLNQKIDLDLLENDGEFLVRLLGLSNELTIAITSEHPEPFNITNMEFRGKFNKKDSLIERR